LSGATPRRAAHVGDWPPIILQERRARLLALRRGDSLRFAARHRPAPRYRPGQKRDGLLVQLVERIHHLQNVATRSRHDLPVQLSAVPERVTFPFDIWRLVDVRWQELGYPSFSAYVTERHFRP
jgi:hypothetical protein